MLGLQDGVEQHQQTQRQDAGNHHGDGVDRRRDILRGDPDVYVVQVRLPVAMVTLQLGPAAHPVPQDGPWVAGLHRQPLVVKLPVVRPPIEEGEDWGQERPHSTRSARSQEGHETHFSRAKHKHTH